MTAHDDLRDILEHHLATAGVEGYTTLAGDLIQDITEWAKRQDEDWPWDDGTPEPEPVRYDPMLMHPDRIMAKLARIVEEQEAVYGWLRRDPGHQEVFQVHTPEREEQGPRLDPDTTALAARWTQDAPTPEHWQPHIRLCPDRGRPMRPVHDTGQTWAGMPVVHNPNLRPGEFYILQRDTP